MSSRLAKLMKAVWQAGRGVAHVVPKQLTLDWGDRWTAHNDVLDEQLRHGETPDAGELAVLRGYLRQSMIVLDVGAHHGYYSLFMAKVLGPSGTVIAIEPSPREQERLYRHIRMNGYTNVRVLETAVGAADGEAVFHVCRGRETGCNSLRPPAVSEETEAVTVPVTTLDAITGEYVTDQPVDFIKLDVEGGELDVLKGSSSVLSRDPRPVLLVELVDLRTAGWGYRSSEIYEYLACIGYTWFEVLPEGRLAPKSRSEHYHQNLIALPEERRQMFDPGLFT